MHPLRSICMSLHCHYVSNEITCSRKGSLFAQKRGQPWVEATLSDTYDNGDLATQDWTSMAVVVEKGHVGVRLCIFYMYILDPSYAFVVPISGSWDLYLYVEKIEKG